MGVWVECWRITPPFTPTVGVYTLTFLDGSAASTRFCVYFLFLPKTKLEILEQSII